MYYFVEFSLRRSESFWYILSASLSMEKRMWRAENGEWGRSWGFSLFLSYPPNLLNLGFFFLVGTSKQGHVKERENENGGKVTRLICWLRSRLTQRLSVQWWAIDLFIIWSSSLWRCTTYRYSKRYLGIIFPWTSLLFYRFLRYNVNNEYTGL